MGDKTVEVTRTAEVAPPAPTSASPQPTPTFVGNTHDVLAIVAATMAGVTGLCCVTGGYGIYCLPLVALVLGIVALVNAKESVNPERTRRWGWISIGTGGVVLLLILAVIACFVIFYGAMIAAALQSVPTPRSY
jgi:hypothetical protein